MTDRPSALRASIGRVMGEVLLREPLGPHEDFFDHGGDSLRAVEVLQRLVEERALTEASATRLRAALLEAIFEDASPAGLATVWLAYEDPAAAGATPGERAPGG
jgi:Phosphopantetheine attachment site